MHESSLSKRDIITKIVEDGYSRSYKMRFVGPGSVEATIPPAVIEREARKSNLTIREFIKHYQVEYLFGDFGGAFVRFIKVSK
jgi:hypothetical protein